MAFLRPSLGTIIERIRVDIEARLPGADAHLRRSVEEVLAIALGGAVHLVHGHLVWLSRQILPDTAEAAFLDRHASVRGLTRKAAVKATSSVPVAGTPGSVCPAGTVWQTNTGIRFVQDAAVTIGGEGTATAGMTAESAGSSGNAAAGVKLSLVSPVAGIASETTLTGTGISGGTDTETDDELRARVLAAWRTPPKGGGAGDYVAWALEVAGVTRAWEYRAQFGTGTVGVSFVRDNDTPIIPDAAEVAAVQTHIDAKAPITAVVTVWAPTTKPVDFVLHVVPDTPTVRAAVQAELADLIAREAEPGVHLKISHIREAISRATGESDHTLTSPAADVTVAAGEIATMGAITWV